VSAQRDESDERDENEKPLAPTPGRASVVVARPGAFLAIVILSCFGAGLAIYWLLRTMHI
jgi:hypothetical protein